ncbi:MAG TPA: NAD(P)H-quinone oxidoreductase [Vicinamibacterales bacterium]|nr:NAD(P)H-quinone oxidoreductase [Vicinamibacterales bacterium]
MIAISITTPGGPDVLRPVEMPQPQPGRNEVLIRVAAAGVNRPDVMQREGKYPPPPGASDTPGLEVSGTIAAVGADARRWREGDQVCALVAGGGYAQYCVAPDVQCLPIPAAIDLISAAGMPETFFTVWTNVFERGRLRAGETFLVHGGTSGIGTTAIQMARAFGARVFATAGTDEKCAACETLGAERAINYNSSDFVAALLPLTDGNGVDVILDMVGAPYFSRNVELLALDGRLVQIAVLRGAKAEMNLVRLLRQRLTITGSTLRARSVDDKGAIAQAVEKAVWPFVDAGKIRPVIFATFPLTQAAEAHRLMESGSHIGKILLTA